MSGGRGAVGRASSGAVDERMSPAAVARRRVVIVGSGVAGLVTALALGDRFDVTIVTKSTIDESNTRYAQGGIAAAVMPGDTVASHVADTLVAGAGLSDRGAVEVLCSEGPERIRDLIEWGVAFDREGDVAGAPFDAGLEGAHSFHRILHAGGDATGFEVESALVRAVRSSTSIEVVESAFVVDLALQHAAGSPRVVGVEVERGGAVETLAADFVVLASGGVGQLFAQTTNPSVTTGDGAAAAWRAGAVLADVEFVQFHPTALAVPGSFLVSEAVRGDGAVLRNADGERFMQSVHPLADLAPRDVVARAIAAEMQRTGAPVYLDATAIGADELERRFPTISAACRANGFDWSREPVPVAPAAHYWMGGIATDLDGRTSLPGLYAVGEVACTGVHGANRLASNSLLESLVFAQRCAGAIAGADEATPRLTAACPSSALPSTAQPEERGQVGSVEPTRAEVRELMQRAAGVYRSANGLREALEVLDGWHIAPSAAGAAGAASAGAGSAVGSVERLETANLLQLARLVVRSALAREESRGAHSRADRTATDAAFEAHLVIDRAHPEPRLAPVVAELVAEPVADPVAVGLVAEPVAVPAVELAHLSARGHTVALEEQVAV